MIQYTQKELQKLFDSLPQELKDTLLSEETAERISEICKRYKITEENIPKTAKLVGDILMGLLPPEELRESLERKLYINKDKAENISREVNRFILFPVKGSLAEFYKEIRFAPGGRIEAKITETKIPKEEEKYKKEKRTNSDIYREPIK